MIYLSSKDKRSYFQSISTGFIFLVLCAFIASCNKKHEVISLSSPKKHRIEAVNKTIDSLFKQDQLGAMNYTRSLLQRDSVVSNKELYFSLVEKMATMKIYIGETDSSIQLLTSAINFWDQNPALIDPAKYGILLYRIGTAYNDKGEPDNAIKSLRKADSIAVQNQLSLLATHTAILLSEIYQSIGDFGHAIEFIEKSIKLCHDNSDSAFMIGALQTYADLYTSCYFFDEANAQFENVLIYKDHFTPYSKFCYYNGRGRMFYLKEDYLNAKTEFLKALPLVEKDETYTNMLILSNLAETSLLLNELDSAKMYLNKFEHYSDILNSMLMFKFNYYSLLGEYYCKSAQYGQAKNAFSISDSVTQKMKIHKVLLKLHTKRKERFFSAIGNYKEAYQQILAYNELDKFLLNEKSRNQVAGLKYKYQRDTTIINQRNDIILREKQIETYKYRQSIYIISIVALLLFVGLVVLFFRKVRALNQEKDRRKIAALKMESIRGRISPHFAFNVLNNIWAVIDNKEVAKAQFDNLMNMIRHSLINTEKMAIPLNEEIEFVKSYIELQNLRMDNDLLVLWNIERSVDMNHLVPGMIIQIPVENAIKHGLLPKIGEKILKIDIAIAEGFLVFMIVDNGIGYHPTAITTKGTGTGLKVLTNTLHLLNQINSQKMSFEMLNSDIDGVPGTKVLIKIPLQYNYNLQ